MPQNLSPERAADEAATADVAGPRTYWLNPNRRYALTALGLGGIVASAGGLNIWMPFLAAPSFAVQDVYCLYAMLLGAGSAWLVVYAIGARAVFYPDAIEAGIVSMRRLRRDDIVARQTVSGGILFTGFETPGSAGFSFGARVMHLLCRNGDIFVLPVVSDDPEFADWFADIPVGNVVSTDASVDPLPGEATEHARQRSAAVRSARWLIWSFGGAAGLFFLIIPASGVANLALLLMLWGAAVVVALTPDFVHLPQAFAKALVFTLYLFSATQIAHAVGSYEPVALTGALAGISLIAGLALLALVAVALIPLRRPAVFAALIPVATVHVFAAMLQIDGATDTEPPRQIPVTIIEKHDYGSRRMPSFQIRVTAWGPRPAGEDHTVPRIVWNRLRPGATICVLVHPGALAIEWFALAYCRPG